MVIIIIICKEVKNEKKRLAQNCFMDYWKHYFRNSNARVKRFSFAYNAGRCAIQTF